MMGEMMGGRKRVEGGGVNQGWEKDVGKLGGWKIGVDDFYSKVACLALLCYEIENGVCEVCLVVGVCLGEGLCVRHERWEVCTFRRDWVAVLLLNMVIEIWGLYPAISTIAGTIWRF